MSDPTGRRGDNIMNLVQAMQASNRGWNKREMQNFLFVRYRMGVREETLQNIIQQLIDRTIIYGKPKSEGSNVYMYFVNDGMIEQVTGVGNVPKLLATLGEEERKRKKEDKGLKQKKKAEKETKKEDVEDAKS